MKNLKEKILLPTRDFTQYYCLDKEGKIWFFATKLASYLGWKNPHDAINKYVPTTSRHFETTKLYGPGNPCRMLIDYDGAMYLFEHSKSSHGKQFRNWLKSLAKEKVKTSAITNIPVTTDVIAKSTAFVAKNFQIMLEQMRAAEKRQDDKLKQLRQEIKQEVYTTIHKELQLISSAGQSEILKSKPIVSTNNGNFRRRVSYVVGQIVKNTQRKNEDTSKAFKRVYTEIYSSFARRYNIRLGARRIHLHQKSNTKVSYMDVIEKDKNLCNLFCAWFDIFIIEKQIEIKDDFVLEVS